MAEQAELDSRIARLDAALTATADALEQTLAARDAAPDLGDDLAAARDELERAEQKITGLESLVNEREEALVAALKRAKTAEANADASTASTADASDQSSQADDTAVLHAEIAELKAARAQDLAEMKALLAELEPMLETADA